MDNKPWIGVDLDGTLAHYDGFVSDEHIGEPVGPMLDRVRAWVDRGIRVKIFTARAPYESCCQAIHAWLLSYGLPALEITNVKDFGMVELWDDRAVRVKRNEGHPCCIT